MKIQIDADAKEIAALVLELQGQQHMSFDEAAFSEAIKRHLMSQDQDRQAFAP